MSSSIRPKACPGCGALNGPAVTRCYRCGRRLLGGVAHGLTSWLGGELIATRAIVLLCLIVFGLAVAVDGRFPLAPELGMGSTFRSSTLLRFGVLVGTLVDFEPWRLLSAVFLHFSALHLGLNMWALLSFGKPIEERFGGARAFLLFVLSAVAGFIVSVAWYGLDSRIPTAGASGGIFGQLGAVIGMIIARKQSGWKELLIQNLVYALIISLMLRVNTAAHLGGFAIGLAMGYTFERARERPLMLKIMGGFAVVCALLSVGSVVASVTSPAWEIVRQQELLHDDE